MNDIITLVTQSYTVDSAGDSIATETTKDVFAERRSIGMKRKMEAMDAGLKLEHKFILADEYEYSGEEILVYNGIRYNIVNSFITDDRRVELTTARF